MRTSKRRYHTELLRLSLAARMVQHEARTETIRRWSGVSEVRVRELYRARRSDPGRGQVVRHRGPPPRQPAIFLRTAHIRHEAAALAALCGILEVTPVRAAAHALQDPTFLRRGELLCRAYEIYRNLIDPSQMTLEHVELLVAALADGTQLRLGHCTACGAAIVFDPYGSGRRVCSDCANSTVPEEAASQGTSPGEGEGIQQRLF